MCDNLVKSRALVCTENSDSHVMVMQSAEERMRGDAPDPLNRAHRLRDDPTGSGTLRSAPPRHRRFGGRVRGFAPAGIGPRDLTQFPPGPFSTTRHAVTRPYRCSSSAT